MTLGLELNSSTSKSCEILIEARLSVGKKELGGGADFLSVIVLFFRSNYGPGQALRDNRVKQFATKPRITRTAAALSCRCQRF
jgi:hypothetical protein